MESLENNKLLMESLFLQFNFNFQEYLKIMISAHRFDLVRCLHVILCILGMDSSLDWEFCSLD